MFTKRFELVIEAQSAPEADRTIGAYEDARTCAWVAYSHSAQFGNSTASYYILETDQKLGCLKYVWRADEAEVRPEVLVVKQGDILSYNRYIWTVLLVDLSVPLVRVQRFEKNGNGQIISLSLANLREARKIVGVK